MFVPASPRRFSPLLSGGEGDEEGERTFVRPSFMALFVGRGGGSGIPLLVPHSGRRPCMHCLYTLLLLLPAHFRVERRKVAIPSTPGLPDHIAISRHSLVYRPMVRDLAALRIDK